MLTVTKHQVTQVLSLDFKKRHLFVLTETFLFNGPSLLILSSRESRIEEKMTSKAASLIMYLGLVPRPSPMIKTRKIYSAV